jgi:RNA polymerase sigma-70 factor (ECF subfamily)
VPGSADEADPAEAEYRPLLFSIAYGMTGSGGDAEDSVQHAFPGLTGARQAGTTIADPKAYLTTTVTRLGISHLHSARMRRETYVGGLAARADRRPRRRTGAGRARRAAYSLSMAFLVLPETLSLVERAVFMLREAFGCGYPDLARISGKTEVNGRQIFAAPGSASPPEGRRATARRSRHRGPTARNSPACSSRPPTAAQCRHNR